MDGKKMMKKLRDWKHWGLTLFVVLVFYAGLVIGVAYSNEWILIGILVFIMGFLNGKIWS